MYSLGILYVPDWLLGIILLFLSVLFYSKWKHSLWRRLGVPGPDPTPFLGCFGHYRKHGLYEYHKQIARKYGKIVGIYFGHLPVVLISDAEIAGQILIKEFSSYPNRYRGFPPAKIFRKALTGAQNDYWKYLRNLIAPSFSTGKLRQMNTSIQECYDKLLQNFEERTKGGKEHVEVKELFGAFTLDVIASTGFGLDINSQRDTNNEFVKRAKAIFGQGLNSPLLFFMVMFPFLGKALAEVDVMPKHIRDVIAYFKSAVISAIESRTSDDKRTDLLQLMLNAHNETLDAEDLNKYIGNQEKWKERGLTQDEIAANSILFLLAGYETTANTLTFTAYCLALNQEYQDRVLKEIDKIIGKEKPDYDNVLRLQYLDMFISEVLRLYSPVLNLNRHTEKDIQIGRYRIPKDTGIFIAVSVMHRDPNYWKDPETFDPERFSHNAKSTINPFSYLPFGIGPRKCLGMRLGLMEIKCAVVSILQKYRFLSCDETEIPVQFGPGTMARPKNGIKLKLQTR